MTYFVQDKAFGKQFDFFFSFMFWRMVMGRSSVPSWPDSTCWRLWCWFWVTVLTCSKMYSEQFRKVPLKTYRNGYGLLWYERMMWCFAVHLSIIDKSSRFVFSAFLPVSNQLPLCIFESEKNIYKKLMMNNFSGAFHLWLSVVFHMPSCVSNFLSSDTVSCQGNEWALDSQLMLNHAVWLSLLSEDMS